VGAIIFDFIHDLSARVHRHSFHSNGSRVFPTEAHQIEMAMHNNKDVLPTLPDFNLIMSYNPAGLCFVIVALLIKYLFDFKSVL
jgi:hypothetical protein